MTEYTPGPWTAGPEYEGDDATFVHANGISVAECGWLPKPIAEANARLIAAAPDMEEAIWQALDDMQDSHCVCEATKQQLRAALDKAMSPQHREIEP